MILAAKIFTLPKKGRPLQDREHVLYFKQYSLFSMDSRSYKTCGKTEALKLLATGRWFDKTVYSPYEIENNEVLNHGNEQNGLYQETHPFKLQERNQPEYQLDKPSWGKPIREEHSSETIRPEPSENQVRRRGRPKRGE